MRDQLDVDLIESDEMVCKEIQRPARVSLWRVVAGEANEVDFLTSIEFTLVDAVGLAAMNRREPSSV